MLFVDILDCCMLVLFDFVGNNLFNMIGNLFVNLVIVLLFVDFVC